MRAIGLLTILILATGAAWPATTIMVRPEAEVIGPTAILGDLASVQGADKSVLEKLVRIPICPTPLPGKSRQVTKSQIIVSLRKAGIADGTIELLCPDSVNLRRAASVITGQALFETARDFALSSGAFPGTAAVEAVRLPADEQVPAGKIELRVKAGAKSITRGRASVPVEIVVDGKTYRTISVQVLVKVLAPVLVATQPISRSTELGTANCAVQERDITFMPDDVVIGEPEAGWSASLPIAEGAVIRESWVSQPPVIRAGDAVLVIVTNGIVRVADKGVAVQDGRVGDRIKVRFPGETREVRGTVTEPGIVQISIGRRA